MVLHLIRSNLSIYLSIYLSIDLLLVALIIRVSSSKSGFREAVGWFVEVCSGLRRWSFTVHGPEPPRKRPKKRSKIVPKSSRKSSKIGPGGSQNRPNCDPAAVQAQVFGPSVQKVRSGRFLGRFWTLFWGVLGAKIVPKSTKMASAKRFILHPFSDLRSDRFSTHFWSKRASKIDVFPAWNREAQLCKTNDFP